MEVDMNITLNAIEGTLIIAAAVIPVILVLGSVEKILTLVDEIRMHKRIERQVRCIKAELGGNFDRAA